MAEVEEKENTIDRHASNPTVPKRKAQGHTDMVWDIKMLSTEARTLSLLTNCPLGTLMLCPSFNTGHSKKSHRTSL